MVSYLDDRRNLFPDLTLLFFIRQYEALTGRLSVLVEMRIVTLLCVLFAWLVLTTQEFDANDYKLHLLIDPEEADVDIVAVHGLDGHWKSSWTADNGVFWLRDLLPLELPRARIFSFGHNSRTRGSSTPLTQDISHHGKDLVSSLSNERYLTGTESRPIIFIGHSLGGLVIKSALLESDRASVGHLERHKSTKISTGAVLYLATPHQGGEGVSLAQIVTRVYSVFSHTNAKLLAQIAPGSDWLQDLQSRYNSISHHFETTFFYETRETSLPLLGKLLLVPKFSAVVPGARDAEDVSMPADHISIVKYSGPDDPNFQRVVERLRVATRHIENRVRRNWDYWNKHREMEACRELNDWRIRDVRARATHGDGVQPTFSHNPNPEEFRVGLVVNQVRNRLFVGRKTVLSYIDRVLTSSSLDRDMNFMRVIVLYGTGGVGKTQIALQYAHQSRSKYDAVFWVDGSNHETAIQSVTRCLTAVRNHYESQIGVARDHPRLRKIARVLEDAIHLRDSPSYSRNPSAELAETQGRLIQTFVDWLSLRENTRWLVIIDNADDPESFDFRDVLPKSCPGSVIITSRRSDLSIMWETVEIPTMMEEEALDLLESSSKLSFPLGSEVWGDARELVNTLGYLPLAIVQAGSFIAVQRPENPIASYLKLLDEHPDIALSYKTAKTSWD